MDFVTFAAILIVFGIAVAIAFSVSAVRRRRERENERLRIKESVERLDPTWPHLHGSYPSVPPLRSRQYGVLPKGPAPERVYVSDPSNPIADMMIASAIMQASEPVVVRETVVDDAPAFSGYGGGDSGGAGASDSWGSSDSSSSSSDSSSSCDSGGSSSSDS